MLHAIDAMTFDHGPTEIIVSRHKEEPEKKCEHFVSKMDKKKERSCLHMT